MKIFLLMLATIIFAGCQHNAESGSVIQMHEFTQDTKVADVIAYKNFRGFGRLIFPTRAFDKNLTLKNLDDVLIWYTEVNPKKSVEIVNYMREKSDAGEKIFYDIYSAEEKLSDPRKNDTGLFFFRGKPNEKFAICNAGGGFYYVGAIHDSFPHALELSKRGYNAFALIYRPDAQLACEDLARAIAFVHTHAEELQVDTKNYSLWGGSAGARMAAWLGSFGTEFFGEKNFPRPAAVIMQYTGFAEVFGNEPPTYNCVGTRDGIANWRTMDARIKKIRANGTPAQIEIFDGLRHGFGLGEGTVAHGWIDRAINFWEKNFGGI